MIDFHEQERKQRVQSTWLEIVFIVCVNQWTELRNYSFCFRLISSESVVSRKLQLIWIYQMINMQTKFKLNIFFNNNNNVDFKLKTMHDFITCHLSHRDNEIKPIQVWLFQLKLKCWYTFFSPFEQTDRITNNFECYKSIYQKHGTNSHLKRTNAISKCRSLTAILCSFHCSLVGIACIFHMEFSKQHAKSANFKTNLMWYSRCIHKCARAPIIYFTIFPSLIL